MSEVQAPGISEREITIYATRGGQMKKIMTNVTTWGELQPLVRREGFDLSSLLAAENINKSDLVNDLAVLPTGNFRLFLRPKQTKSGAPDRKECFAIIKAHLAANPSDKSKFSIDGKNVTQLSTPVVQDLVAKYCNGASADALPKTPVKEKASKTEIVSEKKVVGVVTGVTDADLSPTEAVQEALDLIQDLKGYPSYEKANKHLNRLLNETLPTPQLSEEEELAREAKAMGY